MGTPGWRAGERAPAAARHPRRDSACLRGAPESERHRFAQPNPIHRIASRRRQGAGRRLTDALGEGTKLLQVSAGGTIFSALLEEKLLPSPVKRFAGWRPAGTNLCKPTGVGLHKIVPAGRPPAGRFRGAGNNFMPRIVAEDCSSGRRLRQYCSFPNGLLPRCPARCRLRSQGWSPPGTPFAPPRDHGAKPGACRWGWRDGRHASGSLPAAVLGLAPGARNKFTQKRGTVLCKPTARKWLLLK